MDFGYVAFLREGGRGGRGKGEGGWELFPLVMSCRSAMSTVRQNRAFGGGVLEKKRGQKGKGREGKGELELEREGGRGRGRGNHRDISFLFLFLFLFIHTPTCRLISAPLIFSLFFSIMIFHHHSDRFSFSDRCSQIYSTFRFLMRAPDVLWWVGF